METDRSASEISGRKAINVSLILAERIIALFDEVGATEAERYCAVNMVAAMIPVSLDSRDDAISEPQP